MPGDDFGYETDSDDEVDETLVAVQVVMERRRLAAAAAARGRRADRAGRSAGPSASFPGRTTSTASRSATSSCATD